MSDEREPVAWMVRDVLYTDKCFTDRQQALSCIDDMGMISELLPLYAAPPDLAAENKRLWEAMEVYEAVITELFSTICLGERWFTNGHRAMINHATSWRDKANKARAALNGGNK